MKVSDCKELIQHLVFSSKEDRFSNSEILEKFPELVLLSREANQGGSSLYRVLMLQENTKEDIFGTECTSKNIYSCLNVADEMPQVVFLKDKTITLTPTLYRFEVPENNIFLDYDVVLPLLEEKLKNSLHHKVYSKYDEAIKIGDAIQFYKEAEEAEVIADLSSLEYKKAHLSKPFSLYSGKLIARSYLRNEQDFVYKEYVREWFDFISPLLNYQESNKIQKWILSVEQPNNISSIIQKKKDFSENNRSIIYNQT